MSSSHRQTLNQICIRKGILGDVVPVLDIYGSGGNGGGGGDNGADGCGGGDIDNDNI